jgi:DNA polymerase-3 subunit gamma/tau
MTLLRMLAFAPREGEGGGRGTTAQQAGGKQPAQSQANAAPGRRSGAANAVDDTRREAARPTPLEPAASVASGPLDWSRLLDQLKIGGMARMLAQHSAPSSWDGQALQLQVPDMHRHLLEKPYRDKLQAALEEHFKRRLRVEFALGQPNGQTPAEVENRARQIRQAAAVQAIDRDPFVRELVESFDARVIDESIRPLGSDEARLVDESIRPPGKTTMGGRQEAGGERS